MKSQSSIIKQLSPVNHYTRLPENKQIQMLFRQFQKSQLNRSHQCFLNVTCLNNALLFASLCFGGLSIIQSLSELNQNDRSRLKQQLNKFVWDQKVQSSILFQENAKKLGNIYPFYFEKIFTPFNQQYSHKIKQIFRDISNTTNFLHGVKIRFLSCKQQEFKRIYQLDEISKIDGTKYLIFHQIQGGSCNFGMIFYQIQAANTFANLIPKKQNKQISKPQKKVENIQQATQQIKKPQKKVENIQQATQKMQQQQKMLPKKQNKKEQKISRKLEKKTLRCPCQLI